MKKSAILFLALSSIATPSYSYDGWVGEGKISSIRQQQMLTLIQMSNSSNPGNCANTDFLMFRNDTAYADRFNSSLALAFASGKKESTVDSHRNYSHVIQLM
jgi:hypothetical protein